MNPVWAYGVSPRRWFAGALAAVLVLTGCGGDPAPKPTDPAPTGTQPPKAEARDQLAALAAAAQDRTLTAIYTYRADGRERSVSLTISPDGSWRVDVPDLALGGTVDISIVRNEIGLFQCALPSADESLTPNCVKVGGPDADVPNSIDPKVQRALVTVRHVLTDPGAPLSVSAAPPVAGAKGTCFAVETTTASVSAALDVGFYCYDADGTLTAARLGYGELVLAGPTGPAPASVAMPGPVTDGKPLGMEAPPSPTPTVTGSAQPGT
ncbi:hypothetical protein Ais01nite_32140 [Asanoa ishikariensis]|uniref:Lipoprotein n=1 Tax=Asanoa ishikariensis TaxID=137265 RepID=A0A1H3UVN6_9ACTN|nr:hypothetical protein [Asanoa ishikariensis]GIF65179.1 hypothetical protein Ais01nite_32140 [Asanoa ishikariensis]SDZ66520.1 hypothetical protein SAMN05421684_8214 [Asanoa ishikariensis]